MTISSTTYRTTATMLWVAVGVLLGLMVGIYFELTARVILFLAVASGGSVALGRLNKRPAVIVEDDEDRPDARGVLAPGQHSTRTIVRPAPQAVPPARVTGISIGSANLVSGLLARPVKLAPEEARAWLDELLLTQQRDHS